jgi:hypothetical protein
MWAHYAAEHRGALLAFSTPAMPALLRLLRPVAYVTDFPLERDLDDLARVHLGLGRDNQGEQFLDRLFFTRSAEWSYEREWRSLTDLGLDALQTHVTKEEIFPPGALVSVTTGVRADEALKRELGWLVAERFPSTQVRSSELDLTGFRVHYREGTGGSV